MRKRQPICPRCKTRLKKPGGYRYCEECLREQARESYARCRDRRKNADSNAAPKSAAPTSEDALKSVSLMLAECRRRGYDPDMLLALARGLPKVEFVKYPGGYIHPVWRGRKLGRCKLYRKNIEVK